MGSSFNCASFTKLARWKDFQRSFHQVYFGMLFLIASFVILVSQTVYAFVLAMIILTIGEQLPFHKFRQLLISYHHMG